MTEKELSGDEIAKLIKWQKEQNKTKFTYTEDELSTARMLAPADRDERERKVIGYWKRKQYWINWHKEHKDKNNYAVLLPNPWSLVGLPKDNVWYHADDIRTAIATKEEDRNPWQKSIIRDWQKKRYYAYARKHSPTPEWSHKATRVLTDIDNVEDIVATAGFIAFAIGILVPVIAPEMFALGSTLEAATVPMNAAEAAIGLAAGPVGAKRAIEAVVRMTPLGRLLKIEGTSMLAKTGEKLFAKHFLEEIATKKGIGLREVAKVIPFKKRLKMAMPRWGTMLEAGQAAQTITGYGLVLGGFFGAATDMAFAGVRKVQGKNVKVYMPWEKPKIHIRKAAIAHVSAIRLLIGDTNLLPKDKIKALMAAVQTQKTMAEYWTGKDLTPYISTILESDAVVKSSPSPGTIAAMESLGYEVDPEEGSYVETEVQYNKEKAIVYQAQMVQDEMQAAYGKKDEVIKKIKEENRGYLSEQIVDKMITLGGENWAKMLAKKGTDVKEDIRADFKVMIALVKHNILPFAGIDYGCGMMGIARGFTIDYTKTEVFHVLNKVKLLTLKRLNYSNAQVLQMLNEIEKYVKTNPDINEAKRKHILGQIAYEKKKIGEVSTGWRAEIDALNVLYDYFWKTQRIANDYIDLYETETGVTVDKTLQRPDTYYSWYFDIWDYWRKELKKLTRLYVKGKIKLTAKDFLKHIAFPKPALYEWDTGKFAHKSLSWVFNLQDKVTVPKGLKWYFEPAWQKKQTFNYVGIMDYFSMGISDDLLRQYTYIEGYGLGAQLPEIDAKKKNYNRILQHTAETILRIGGWQEVPSRIVFSIGKTTEEEEKIKKRLIGCDSHIYYYYNYYTSDPAWRLTLETYPPFNMRFYAYHKPPLFIMTKEERKIFSAANVAHPAWWNNTRLRNIFHKWLITCPYWYGYEQNDLSLDKLKEMYEELLERGISVPAWPTKTEKRLRLTGNVGGTEQINKIVRGTPGIRDIILKQMGQIAPTAMPQITINTDLGTITDITIPNITFNVGGVASIKLTAEEAAKQGPPAYVEETGKLIKEYKATPTLTVKKYSIGNRFVGDTMPAEYTNNNSMIKFP